VPDVAKILFSLFTAILPGKKCYFVSVMPKKDDLLWLKKKIEEQRVRVVLDKTYSLEDAAKAHSYMEKGHARGKVVLTL
jgi:NADPH:quinone reductase-like Zn-dependent oxidoreductase